MLNVSSPPRSSKSSALVNDHERRINAELDQLVTDIRRIGDSPGSPHVSFGELFDDDGVQNYYEALVGTLKCAKKRGIVTFKGQMLLKGMHDEVTISIVGGEDQNTNSNTSSKTPTMTESKSRAPQTPAPPAEETPTRRRTPSSKSKVGNSSPAMKVGTNYKSAANESLNFTTAKQGTPSLKHIPKEIEVSAGSATKGTPGKTSSGSFPTSSVATKKGTFGKQNSGRFPTPASSFTPPRNSRSTARTSFSSPQKISSVGNASDTETELTERKSDTVNRLPNVSVLNLSDSEAEVVAERRTSPRARPKRWQSARGSIADRWTLRTSTSGHSWKNPKRNLAAETFDAHHDKKQINTMSPIPQHAATSSESPVVMEDKEIQKASTTSSSSTRKPKSRVGITVVEKQTAAQTPDASSAGTSKNNEPLTAPAVKKSVSLQPPASKPRNTPVLPNNRGASIARSKSEKLSASIGAGIDEEVEQLLVDIRRVGSNPGESSVTFGELFDDDIVQNTYEALIGTLRSAKRKGFIKFKGQVLFKGMHDDVLIEIAEKE